MNKEDFISLLSGAQRHISALYSEAVSDKDKTVQLRAYIEKYLRDKGFTEETELKLLIDRIYSEMAEYSVLTKYLGRKDIEEVNLNGWDDIAVTYRDGRTEKAKEHFLSPKHAEDIVKRLLHHSGMIIDNACPIAQGHLPGNTRITAVKTPVVDEDRGISASIRLLHNSDITTDKIVSVGTATEKMTDFLCMCLRYGVSFLVAGATSSGKTTLLNALLATVPDEKRIFTIESGSRELSLIKRKDGRVVNNVVHTLSRPSEDEGSNIAQEDLVVASLRFDPDIVVLGEIRDAEAYSAVEASLTGHTVVSTIHALAADSAHTRLALLCQKKFPIKFETSLAQAAQAFPLIVFAHKLEDNKRKIMDISECVVSGEGKRTYRTLFRYSITENRIVNGKYEITGHFEQPEAISDSLKKRLLQYGAPAEILQKFERKGAEYE